MLWSSNQNTHMHFILYYDSCCSNAEYCYCRAGESFVKHVWCIVEWIQLRYCLPVTVLLPPVLPATTEKKELLLYSSIETLVVNLKLCDKTLTNREISSIENVQKSRITSVILKAWWEEPDSRARQRAAQPSLVLPKWPARHYDIRPTKTRLHFLTFLSNKSRTKSMKDLFHATTEHLRFQVFRIEDTIFGIILALRVLKFSADWCIALALDLKCSIW